MLACHSYSNRLDCAGFSAQREGLLFESDPGEDIADPYFAYCKQHAEKASMRAKRRNFLAMTSARKRFDSVHAALPEKAQVSKTAKRTATQLFAD